MGGAIAKRARLPKETCSLANSVFIQQVAQASHGHLQNLRRSCLIATRSLKGVNNIVLLKLCEIRFEIDSFIRQIKIRHHVWLVPQDPFRQPFGFDAPVNHTLRWSIVFPSPIESSDSAVF